MGRTRAFMIWSLRPVARFLKGYSLLRASFLLPTRWDTWLVYPIKDTESPRREPLRLKPTSSPSMISGAGVLVESGITVNLARLVLILHYLLKVLMRAISLPVRALIILLEWPGW